MASTPTNYRINQIAKDLNIKSKDILEVFADKGGDKTHMAVLEPDEFEFLMMKLTEKKQIKNIDDYLSGKIAIEDQKAKKEPKEAKEKPAPEAKENTPKEKKNPEPKAAEPAPAAEPEKKPAPAAKSEPAPQKKESEKKPEPKQEAKPEQKPQQKEQPREQSARPAQNGPVQFRPNNNQPRPGQQNRDGQGQRSDRPAQNGQRPAPQQGQNRGQDFQRSDRDGQNRQNDQARQNGPKPQRAENRPQNTVAPKPKILVERGAATRTGGKRVIDTRSGDVDLSKYDERFENLAQDMGGEHDARPNKQKLKKKNNNDNGYKKSNGQDKEKLAIERMKKLELEKARKAQLHITVPDEISVGELASRLKITVAELIKKLMLMGVMATVNQIIDYDTAFLIADEMNVKVTREVVVTIEEKLFEDETDAEEDLVERSPVVVVMGHVDHGKTSLLDAIRHTNVTTGEAGGITQHIGAYRVNINDKDITFLDTPGHEAFTAMRARGAMATDIAILVVAADDGIMPQTIEAINHAKAAGVDIIVAINKMDKPTANPDNVKQSLTKYDLVPEEWGGDVICVPVSAVTRMGIDDLLENVLLVAEMKELKANPSRHAKGIVIEAKLDKGRGPVASILVQNGTLHTGDIVIAGTSVGRVRAMLDDKGRKLAEAGPSVPVEIVGLSEVPSAGDELNAVEDERMARELAEQRRDKAKEDEFKANAKANLDDLFAQISDGVKNLNIIVKADVGGSAEAVKASLLKLSNEEVKVNVIHSAAGGINEGDVMLADASNAIIVGFNVRPDKNALDRAALQNVDIRTYRIIYECIEEISAAMKGLLAPQFKEVILGHADVRQTIHVPNVGTIAGCYITDGKVARNAQIRVTRDSIVIFEDKISSLKRFKDDAKEVLQGFECGVGLERFNDIKEGDILEAFIMEEVER